MKSINTLLTLLLLAVFSVSVRSADYSLELEQEIRSYINALHNSNSSALTEVADQISASGLSDTTLFDAVEDTLITHHRLQLLTPRDETLVPPMISLIRALASSGNDKYLSTLERILHESSSRASRNRAKHVITKLDWYKERNGLMQNLNSHAAGQSLQTTRFINLLQHHDYIFKRYAAEEIYRLGTTEPPTLAIMAEALKQNATAELDGLQVDTLAWYCRVLGKVAASEQREFIEALADNKNAHKKIRKHCRNELKQSTTHNRS